MNPDVKGDAINLSPYDVISKMPELLEKSDLVIADNLSWDYCVQLDNHLRSMEAKKTLFVLMSCGLVGLFRISTPEYTSYQTKPDNPKLDLRINEPWDELLQFVKDMDIDNITEKLAHKFVPFPIILIHLMLKFKEGHNGKFPQNGKENNEFREMVKSGAKFGGFVEEENYEEAYQRANNAFVDPKEVPRGIEMAWEVLEKKDASPDSNKDNFYFLTKTLKKFFDDQGRFPVSGDLPDCHSDTDTYLKLKGIYRNKFEEDLKIFKGYLENLVKEDTKNCASNENLLADDSIVREFVKNWLSITCYTYRSLAQENEDVNRDEFMWDGEDVHEWYFVFRCWDKFRTQKNRAPNPEDFTEMRKLVDEMLETQQMDEFKVDDAKVKEICRYQDSQVVTTASVLGGLCSQEIIKIITQQFEPLNNTLIFEGIESRGASVEF